MKKLRTNGKYQFLINYNSSSPFSERKGIIIDEKNNKFINNV